MTDEGKDEGKKIIAFADELYGKGWFERALAADKVEPLMEAVTKLYKTNLESKRLKAEIARLLGEVRELPDDEPSPN